MNIKLWVGDALDSGLFTLVSSFSGGLCFVFLGKTLSGPLHLDGTGEFKGEVNPATD